MVCLSQIPSLTFTALLLLTLGFLQNAQAQNHTTVEATFPGLAAGILKTAYLAKLPLGTLLTVDKVTVKEAELAQTISKAPAPLQAQLKKNGVFLLEDMASNSLLLKEAQAAGYKKTKDEAQMIRGFLGEKVKDIQVSEEDLIRSYDENKSSFGGAPLEEVRGILKEVLLQQERKKAMESYIQRLSRRSSIYVDESWIKKQALLARDNPVDKLRLSGKPSLVDFGSTGCGPCDLMTPILDKLKKKYQGTLNVSFVHVQEEQFLATRFGIRFIPVQVFFDKTGTEVFRHSGFFPEAEIEKKIAQLQLL
jgi:thiol-disulfide isomerase/thioredoxin